MQQASPESPLAREKLRRNWSPTAQTLAALAAGLTLGIAIALSGSAALQRVAAAAEPVGVLWIHAIRMTVIPLVVSLLFVSISSFPDAKSAGRTGGWALLAFAAFVMTAALFGVLTIPALFSWLPGGASATALAQMPAAASVTEQAQQLPSVGEWLVDLVPTNPVRAAADGAMLPLVIFIALFGFASTGMVPERRQVLVQFFRAVGEAMLTLVRWLIALAPLGVFALILPLAARMGTSAVGAFGYYVAVICGVLIALTVGVYPIAVVFGQVSLKRFAQAVFPAQTIAFSSTSSLASLPPLLEGADRLQCPPAISGFVLPLAVSVFKMTTPISWLAGACFVARLYGLPLSAQMITTIAIAAVVLSFSSLGIPRGSIVVLAPVFANFGLPVEGVGILMALDFVPDLFKTIANVTADMAAVVVIARFARRSELRAAI